MSSIYSFDEVGEDLCIRSLAMPSGRKFDVGRILEPESENPLLELKSPLGTRGVRQILELLDEWREEMGLVDDWHPADAEPTPPDQEM